MGRAQSRPDPFEPAMRTQLRIARPVTDLSATAAMYIQGLELEIIGEFNDHDGFDGIMLGTSAQDHHFEFTFCRNHPIQPSPTQEDLLVFYLPKAEEWEQRCSRMLAAGFREVQSFNPYWAQSGRTFEDRDGYRLVIQRAGWGSNSAA
jgi:hypothetical protein